MNAHSLLLGPVVLLLGCGEPAPLPASNAEPSTPAVVACADETQSSTDFYLPPEPLPEGLPGTLLRCETVNTPLSALARSRRMMYLSTDMHGQPIAVTGMVLEPLLPWQGSGERPLIGFTVGTQGQGDQCAPSRLLVEGLHYQPLLDLFAEYELPFLLDFLGQGMAVVLTDYEGLGTPSMHTYLNPVAEAHANLDAVRASRQMADSRIPSAGPIAFAGFSQGGGAAAGTAEALDRYAPELDVVGVYAGAPPRTIPSLFRHLDGDSFAGVMGYFLNGLAAAFPELQATLDAELNAAGQDLRAQTAEQCALETIALYGYQPSTAYTRSGQSIPDWLDSDPALELAVQAFALGNTAPSVPVLLGGSEVDDVVPVAEVRALAADWCAQGATVELLDLPLPAIPLGTGAGHFVDAAALYILRVRAWLQERFEGAPPSSTCP